MHRLLSVLLMIMLLVSSGTSMAAAICRHQSAQEHADALSRHDGRAAAAQMEDAARSVVSKAGALADAISLSMSAYLVPSPMPEFVSTAAEPMRIRHPDSAKLASLAIAPLLEPPAV